MSCDDIQELLALYADDGLTLDARSVCYGHLEVCPVCRAHLEEVRAIRRGLATLSRPPAPANLVSSINQALTAEAASQNARSKASYVDLINDQALVWLQPRLMRYAFSSLTSVLLFASVFMALRPHMLALHEATLSFDAMMISLPIESPGEGYDINKPISPESYSALRAPFNTQSPSLNPGGALATLTGSPLSARSNQRQDADDMVVVADVYSNGSASLAEIMHAPRDRRMLQEFDKALRQDAAFVPASMDRRPETMRVVFSVQRVNVRESN
jgi:Putative zinc-finger